MELITKSPQETQRLGSKVAADLRGGEILALSGELGSGKTTFVQGLAKTLGIKQRIISPTYILVRRYDLKEKFLYHVDLYRFEKNVIKEIKNIGLEEMWDNPNSITVIEWAEKIKDIIPKSATWIYFENIGKNKRKIVIKKK